MAPTRGRRGRLPGWVGVTPFFVVAFLFLLWPAYSIVLQAFVTETGQFTLDNVASLAQTQYASAFLTSTGLSLVTALIGGVIGTALAYAISVLPRPRFLKSAITTFSGVAAQFGGVPLAFAFVATIGSAGFITQALQGVGIDLYGSGFSLLSFTGLVVVYLYFQIPLMVIVIAPAIEGLKDEWREAAASLGATNVTYWWRIGIPLLLPAFVGGVVLLFANSFAAYATAQVLTSGSVNLVPIQIGFFIQGNVVSGSEQFGFALTLGMIVIVTIALVVNQLLQRRTSRWSS
jgi:putative spermidine/putrescine transport system permease protein